MLAGLRPKILSSDSSRRTDSARLGAAARPCIRSSWYWKLLVLEALGIGGSWYWSPGIAAPHTEKQAFAEDSDDNTANPGQDGFRVKAEKRPSRVRYRQTGG